MEVEGDLNLYDFTLMALRPSTRQIIVNELNRKKVLASEEGLPRDWRGLAELAGLSAPAGDNPASHLLATWEKDSRASLGQLLEFLGRLDRWDIVDDVTHLIREDAMEFSGRMHQVNDTSTNNMEVLPENDNRVLTFDDISRLRNGMELQMYDALLLYADEDLEFANQMVDRLENDFFLTVCRKDNLVGGLAFEHQGIMRLISERCRRVIIILSQNFVNSPVNMFFTTFAQALAIEQRKRIIIPCMYERNHINLPMEIQFLHKLDYNRQGLRHYDFWQQLRYSVTSVTSPPLRHSPVSIREISNSTREQIPVPQDALKQAERRAIKPVIEEPKRPMEAEIKKFSSNLIDVKGNICSSSMLNVTSQKFSCSSLSLPEKKHKSKSPTEFFRKFFKVKKSKKIAVRL